MLPEAGGLGIVTTAGLGALPVSAALQEMDKKHACFGGAWYAEGCLHVLGSLCAFGELECVGGSASGEVCMYLGVCTCSTF